MTTSWIILTYNRAETVKSAFNHNYVNSGSPIEEIIHVDNGSNQFDSSVPFMSEQADVQVLNKQNLGVAKGYNRGYVLSTKEYVVITGCDRLMPNGWLLKMKAALHEIKDCGIVSIYSQPLDKVPERRLSRDKITIGNATFQEAIPFEARMLSKKLFLEIGFLREDFGLYSREDNEWHERATRVLKAKGLKSYVLTSSVAQHQGTEGVNPYDGKDQKEYHEFKQREASDPKKEEHLVWCRKNGNPYFNPYV